MNFKTSRKEALEVLENYVEKEILILDLQKEKTFHVFHHISLTD